MLYVSVYAVAKMGLPGRARAFETAENRAFQDCVVRSCKRRTWFSSADRAYMKALSVLCRPGDKVSQPDSQPHPRKADGSSWSEWAGSRFRLSALITHQAKMGEVVSTAAHLCAVSFLTVDCSYGWLYISTINGLLFIHPRIESC